jgi:hypothetical protein
MILFFCFVQIMVDALLNEPRDETLNRGIQSVIGHMMLAGLRQVTLHSDYINKTSMKAEFPHH